MAAGGADLQSDSIGTRPLGKLTSDQQENVLVKRRLVDSERARVALAQQLAAERRAAALQASTLSKSEQAVRAPVTAFYKFVLSSTSIACAAVQAMLHVRLQCCSTAQFCVWVRWACGAVSNEL